MSFLTGGSKSKQTSTSSAQNQSTNWSFNRAYNDIANGVSPLMGNAAEGSSVFGRLLGLNGNGGYNAWKQNAGFDWGAERGGAGLFANAAARRLLDSGATRKAMMAFGEDYSHKFFNDYIQQLMQYSGLGLNAGQLLAGAGNMSGGQSTGTANSYSTGTSSQKNGLGSLIGSALAIASS
jgi:hypothetical protein